MKLLSTQVVRFCLVVFILINAHPLRAQYVIIPDAHFVTWLDANGFAGCMTGNQLDTTCSTVLNTHGLYCSSVPIRDLTGIQYFKNLDTLECNYDSITIIPSFPSTLQYLDCSNNQLNTIPSFPPSLTYLDCENNSILTLPALPTSVAQLNCGFNLLSTLPTLPSGLTLLYCNYNSLNALQALPAGLVDIDCSSNQLTALPSLPNTLQQLICEINQISALPVLSTTALITLKCTGNQLDSIPALPATLQTFYCSSNLVKKLPSLPAGLIYLACDGNQLSSLQSLPTGLQYLNCAMNNITTLPLLPSSLTNLLCNQNQLTSLPEFPDSLYQLNCYYNQYLTCLPQIKRIVNLQFFNCGVTCLPNYGKVTTSNPVLGTLPLCGLFNPTGCHVYADISGQVFEDYNHNCAFDDTDKPQPNVKVALLSNGNLMQQVYTDSIGDYSFQATDGKYTLRLDTTGLPFKMICPHAGSFGDSLTVADSVSFGNNFAFECKPSGFDLGVTSILNNYLTPVPGSTITLNTICGDVSALYGAHCAAGISGQVQLTFSGPVTYTGPATGAITPTTASGSSIIWAVPDFGPINNYKAFNTLFTINANALPGQQICINVTLTSGAGDFYPDNNTLTYCFSVAGVAASNFKEVYPAGKIDSANQWLTYTIRFSNTGSDTAKNLMITDTLDPNLNVSSFDLLNASAKNITRLTGNVAQFNFPNINLPPASVSGDSAASGFVQYRIQTLNNMAGGTLISNTANIYFNLANPVTTNTVTDTVVRSTVSVQAIPATDFGIRLFPNPTSNQLNIEITQPGKYTLRLLDIQGKLVYTSTAAGTINALNVATLAPGIYLAEIVKGENTQRVRWVKM